MLLEREPELTVVRKAVLEVESGQGALLLIDGQPGTGTTALLRELVATGEETGARVLRCGGARSERRLPLGVVRQLVLPLLASEKDLIPAASREMLAPVSGGAGLDPGEDIGIDMLVSVLHGLHTALAELAATRTVLLVVDDLHRVDEASLRALAFLAARLDGMRLLIGAVLQEGTGTRSPMIREIECVATRRLHARALSAEATATLVTTRFGDTCAPEFADACHELTGGRPKELRVLLDRALAQRLRGRAAEVPRIRALGGTFRRERLLFLLRRDPAADTFAKAVVVLADHATEDLVARLSGLSRDECAAARAVLRQAGLLSGTGRPEACDPTMARVIEESLSAEESSRLYRAAAVLLEESGAAPEAIAAQLLHVDRLRDCWEIDQLRAAAVAARRRGAWGVAVRYLRRALQDLPAEGRERADVLVELAAVELVTLPDSAVRHLAQAARLMPDHRSRAEVLSWAPLHMTGGGPLAGLIHDVFGRFGEVAAPHGYDRDMALRLEARSRFARFEDPDALTSAMKRLAELGGGAAPVGWEGCAERELRVVLLQSAALTGRLGSVEVVRMARKLLDHEPTNSDQMSASLQMLPWILLAADAGDAVSSWLDAALTHVRRQGKPELTAVVEAQRSVVLLGRGHVAKARECALLGFTLAERDRPETKRMASIALGTVALELQDFSLINRVLAAIGPGTDLAAVGSGTDLSTVMLRRNLRGDLAAARGDLPAALAQFLDCGRLLDRAGWRNPATSRWLVSAALLHHRLGEAVEAIELSEELHRRALAWGAPTMLGRALRVRGMVTDGPRGVESLRQAAEVLRDVDSRQEFSRTLIVLGKRVQKETPVEGDRLLARGRRLARQLRTSAPGEWAGGLVRAVTPASAAVARSVLTSAEATVAELAARGRSNQEIAGELDITRRAVEKHLTGCYRKLDVGGRAELAEALGVHHRGE
ncbi:AAA family ATPase [Streptomyces sp. NPDC088116]|uniref:AAA family ATPase n=1 Tax=Streptomyces sp. NPDC088116 TaxID=3365825 RepID=UPI00380BD314